MEKIDFEIRDSRYQLECPPVDKARPLLVKLMRKMGDAVNGGIGAGTDNKESLTIMLLLAVLRQLDDQLLNDCIAVFTPYTFFEKDGLWPCLSTDKNHWNSKGLEGLGDQFEWLQFCLKHTYSDFLARVQTKGLSQGAKTP